MELLTNSARRKFGTCPRAFYFAYKLKRRPKKDQEALYFGTVVHKVLEAWWISRLDGMQTVLDTILDNSEKPYFLPTVRALMYAYNNLYANENLYETIAVEKYFECPLINPETGSPSKTWVLAGKIDAIAREKELSKIVIIEHKTTSEDIAPDSSYWMRLKIDGQISGYYLGARSLGFDAQDCLYDVIKKPTIKPFKETAEKKYKADGTLYANMHAADEEPSAWEKRLSEDILNRPEFYFQRKRIARTESDMEEYLYDAWACGREIADADRMNRWPRRPNACIGFGECEYFNVCSGCASIEDDSLYVTLETPNPELEIIK